MPWFGVDDDWWAHPKTLAVSLAARGLWATAGSWCMKHLTEGFVPSAALPVLGGVKKQVDELIRARLWESVEGGWQFHDWDDYQPDADDLKERKEQNRARQKRHREKEKRNALRNGGSNGAQTALRNAESNALQNALVTPLPIPNSDLLASSSDKADTRDARVYDIAQLSSSDVAREWHRAMGLPGGANGLTHAESSWREAYETVAVGIAAKVERKLQTVALRAVCEWFWIAPDGPIQGGRVSRRIANPGKLAKFISTDLDAANAWWCERESHKEAAQ